MKYSSNETKDQEPRLLSPASLSFKTEGEIECFQDKTKMTKVHFHQTSTARNAKGTPLRGEGNGEKEEHRSKRGNMAVKQYLSIITLNVNGFNDPIKRHRVDE